MIFRRALIRDLSLTTSAALVVLVAIALVTLFIRLLGDVARGELANEAVFTFLGFALLRYLPVLLTIALFLGVMLSLSRVWRDSEMAIWLSSGVSLAQWIRPVLSFALPVVVVMSVLSVWIIPWSIDKKNQYNAELASRNQEAAITPGLFAEGDGGNRVYFVEALNPLTGTIKNIFLQTQDKDKLGLVVANEGREVVNPDGTRYLVLKRGRRYEGAPGQLEYALSSFEHYWMRLDPVDIGEGGRDIAQERTGKLIRLHTAAADGELLWRSRPPISALILVLLAIPLSYVNTRARRSYSVILALLLYFVYNNLLSLTQAWVTQQKLGFWLGFGLVHVLMAALVIALFHLRTHPWRVRRR
jgi:Predicted permeases